MTLKEISSGTDIMLWIVFAFLAIMSIVLLSGHGSGLIAGYNTASEDEKNQYDEKKLCRVIGAGMLVITLLILVMAIWEAVLPASFAFVTLVIVVVDCAAMIIAANTICKK